MDNNNTKRSSEEIKKALLCCSNSTNEKDCVLQGCPYYLENSCTKNSAIDAVKLIEELEKGNQRLLQIAKKMHTWIFLHSFDEEEAYKELGLTEEENFMLGYLGKVEIAAEETKQD